MRRKLILLMSVMALMMPHTTKAQEEANDNSLFWYMHEKDLNPSVTLTTKAEEIIDKLLLAEGRENCMMKQGTWLELERKETDAFGNVHVTYSQMSDPEEFSEYQLVLHFRPDGSLYYKNGTIIIETKEAQKAKARKSQSKISAERASIIATGSPVSETVSAFADYKNKPREAYKVKDTEKMQYVYVDAYSGEVLYTVPLIYAFAPMSEMKGNAVKLYANTSYNGLQELTVMQTDKGYILRDPERNIITIDATDVLADRDSTNLPNEYSEQFQLFTRECDDVTFTNEEELRNQEYATALRRFTIWLDPDTKVAPDTIMLHVYLRDHTENHNLSDVINMVIKDDAWTNDNGRLKCSITFEDKPRVDILQHTDLVDITIDGEPYFLVNVIASGNKETSKLLSLTTGDFTNMECLFDVEADAAQPAIDVHWNIQKVYDMYNEYYGIKGCDDKGSQILNIVNPGNNVLYLNTADFPYNAAAVGQEMTDCNGEPSWVMVYGMGGDGEFKPLTSFDVTAHEFTHNVTTACCNKLLYKNESGALNEALADCMAMVAEDYMLGAPTWQIGEDVTMVKDNMRDLSNPWYSGCIREYMLDDGVQPKYYGGEFWIDYNETDADNGGVHRNSGVFNHLFYLLCEGGESLTNEMDVTSDFIPVGMEKMKDILFHTMRYYNASLCTYKEIADNLMMAVEDIYSDNGETISDVQAKMLNAYDFVGMESKMFPSGITRHQMSSVAKNSRTYNLLGIPVGDDYKGMVIKNGKKVLRK